MYRNNIYLFILLHNNRQRGGPLTEADNAAFQRLAAKDCDNGPVTRCNRNKRFRETDGQCNNLHFRFYPSGGFKMGAAFTQQQRFLEPDYDDGMYKLAISVKDKTAVRGIFPK